MLPPAARWLVTLALLAAGGGSVQAQSPPPSAKSKLMSHHAAGTFEVKLLPQPPADATSAVGRMSLDKTFRGDLEGTGKGEMLAFRAPVEGSAGYVAMERVEGTLHGRRGTFVFQHTGLMNRGAQSLSIAVVPDSGTGELAGLAGKFDIVIADGKHSYKFDYTLPAKE